MNLMLATWVDLRIPMLQIRGDSVFANEEGLTWLGTRSPTLLRVLQLGCNDFKNELSFARVASRACSRLPLTGHSR